MADLTRAELAALRLKLFGADALISASTLQRLLDMASRCVSEEALHALMGPMWKSGHSLGTDTISEREAREAMALVVRDLADAARDALARKGGR
jgi:hypothetical protein